MVPAMVDMPMPPFPPPPPLHVLAGDEPDPEPMQLPMLRRNRRVVNRLIRNGRVVNRVIIFTPPPAVERGNSAHEHELVTPPRGPPRAIADLNFADVPDFPELTPSSIASTGECSTAATQRDYDSPNWNLIQADQGHLIPPMSPREYTEPYVSYN